MGAVILILLLLAVVVMVVGVIGWMSGWWLTTKTDAVGEPGTPNEPRGSTAGGPPAGRPVHTSVEDEADQRIVGGAGENR